jgi:hypothetical protein
MLRVREETVFPVGVCFDEGATDVLALLLVAADLVAGIASRDFVEVGATGWSPDRRADPG